MRMPSLRNNTEQEYITEGNYPIKHWIDNINNLIQEYGQDMVLYTESSTNVSLRLGLGLDSEMAFEQPLKHNIEDNPEMTLKQWKECLQNINYKYGEKYTLYTLSDSHVSFYLSPIDRY